ncbi:hypothetical protein D3C74_429060 [compost metagenome]
MFGDNVFIGRPDHRYGVVSFNHCHERRLMRCIMIQWKQFKDRIQQPGNPDAIVSQHSGMQCMPGVIGVCQHKLIPMAHLHQYPNQFGGQELRYFLQHVVPPYKLNLCIFSLRDWP